MLSAARKWLREVVRGDGGFEDSVYKGEQLGPCCVHSALPTPCLPDTGTPLKNLNVFKEELPAHLAIYTELGNREGDPTEGTQSLPLTLNSKHKAYIEKQ